MKSLKPLLVFLSFLLVASSCDRNNDPPSKSEMLTQSNWILEKVTTNPAFPLIDTNGDTTLTSDVSELILPCDFDNVFSFTMENTFVYSNGDTKCSGGDPQVLSEGTWEFGTDETEIHLRITGFNNITVINIAELTETSLSFVSESYVSGSKYTVIETYKHDN